MFIAGVVVFLILLGLAVAGALYGLHRIYQGRPLTGFVNDAHPDYHATMWLFHAWREQEHSQHD